MTCVEPSWALSESARPFEYLRASQAFPRVPELHPELEPELEEGTGVPVLLDSVPESWPESGFGS